MPNLSNGTSLIPIWPDSPFNKKSTAGFVYSVHDFADLETIYNW